MFWPLPYKLLARRKDLSATICRDSDDGKLVCRLLLLLRLFASYFLTNPYLQLAREVLISCGTLAWKLNRTLYFRLLYSYIRSHSIRLRLENYVSKSSWIVFLSFLFDILKDLILFILLCIKLVSARTEVEILQL